MSLNINSKWKLYFTLSVVRCGVAEEIIILRFSLIGSSFYLKMWNETVRQKSWNLNEENKILTFDMPLDNKLVH